MGKNLHIKNASCIPFQNPLAQMSKRAFGSLLTDGGTIHRSGAEGVAQLSLLGKLRAAELTGCHEARYVLSSGILPVDM